MTVEKYTKWLKRISAQFNSIISNQREMGRQIPEEWLEGIGRIEEEINKVKREGFSHLFPREN